MTIIEFILIAGWTVWIAIYFHLAWNNGKAIGLNYSIMFFPFFLFVDRNWSEETAMSRMKLKLFALVLLVATTIVAFAGESNAL